MYRNHAICSINTINFKKFVSLSFVPFHVCSTLNYSLSLNHFSDHSTQHNGSQTQYSFIYGRIAFHHLICLTY